MRNNFYWKSFCLKSVFLKVLGINLRFLICLLEQRDVWKNLCRTYCPTSIFFDLIIRGYLLTSTRWVTGTVMVERVNIVPQQIQKETKKEEKNFYVQNWMIFPFRSGHILSGRLLLLHQSDTFLGNLIQTPDSMFVYNSIETLVT